MFITYISNLIFKLRLILASPSSRPELMRKKFYFLGKNVLLYTYYFGTEPYLISIGNNVQCATGVRFVNHDVSCFNIATFLGLERNSLDKVGKIVLKDNCFVGAEAMLMPGCIIGENSIIAARSVVTKNVPDNEVWGGVPAKFMMTTEEYSKHIIMDSEKYPWIDVKNGYKKKTYSKSEIIKLRQKYFYDNQE